MKLTALKAETYRNWQTLYKVQEAYVQVSTPVQDAVFKQEMRGYGDLRCKVTWERAFTSLLAKLLYDYNDDSTELILLHFLEFPQKNDFTDLVPLLIEQFMMFPYGLHCLVKGLQAIANYGTPGYSTSVLELRAFAHECYAAAVRTGRADEFILDGVSPALPSAA